MLPLILRGPDERLFMHIVTEPNWDSEELLVFDDRPLTALAILLNSLFKSVCYY